MKCSKRTWLPAAAVLLLAANGTASAGGLPQWWPLKVIDASSGKDVPAEYTPLQKAEKPYKLCVLLPHLKDSFFVGEDYGLVEEARRQGVNMTVYEAGGYENLNRQLSQFDDCLAAHADAIISTGISEEGMGQKYTEAMNKGIPVISLSIPVTHTKIAGRVYADFPFMGGVSGHFLVKYLKGKPASVVTFPGPAGAGWPEGFNDGFKDAIKGTSVKFLGEKFGDSGVQTQTQLIQDALQAYPDMNVVFGAATAAEAAVGAVAQAGRGDILILSEHENQAMLDLTKRGEILGFATQYVVANAVIAVDQAIRAIEKKPMMTFVKPIPDMVSKETLPNINLGLSFAPADFKPIFSVKQ
jgi:periplasmic protein TorT